MEQSSNHGKELDHKITALSDALAHMGRGASLKELLKIIRLHGDATPAELAFTNAVLDNMQAHVQVLAKIAEQLLAASKQVVQKGLAAPL